MPTTVLWFGTDEFVDSEEQRQQRLNEDIGGASLAAWLSEQLRVAGQAAGQPWAEDHGWNFEVKINKAVYSIVCTIEDIAEEERQACVQIHLGKPGRTALDPSDPVLRQITVLLEGQGATIDID